MSSHIFVFNGLKIINVASIIIVIIYFSIKSTKTGSKTLKFQQNTEKDVYFNRFKLSYYF